MNYLGIDHVDVRVRSLPLVEAFYDAMMPELGLTRKSYAMVDAAGDWHDAEATTPYNTVEYHEEHVEGRAARFMSIVEHPATSSVATRVAFALATPDDVRAWTARLAILGARDIGFEDDFDRYPAVFFTDPAGTPLEFCARRAKAT